MLSHLSHVCWLFETPWTVARQAPLSTGVSRQEYWSGLPYPPPGDPPDPGIKSTSPGSSCSAGGFFTTLSPQEAQSSRTGVPLLCPYNKRTPCNKRTPKTHTCTEGGPREDPERGPPSPSQREPLGETPPSSILIWTSSLQTVRK